MANQFIEFPPEIKIKSYVAILTQTGTSNPTVTVLHNSIGEDIIWTRANVGVYTGTTNGKFTLNKTTAPPFTTGSPTRLPLRGTVNSGSYSIKFTDINNISLELTTTTTGNIPVELSTIGGNLLITINIYK